MASSSRTSIHAPRRSSEPFRNATAGPATRTGSDTPSRTDRATDLLVTFLHFTCRKCDHWHDGVPKAVSSDPTQHTSIHCDYCKKKIFGIGRRSTHASLISRETTSSFSPTGTGPRRQAVTCINDDSSISPRQSVPRRRSSAFDSARVIVEETTLDPDRISEKSSHNATDSTPATTQPSWEIRRRFRDSNDASQSSIGGARRKRGTKRVKLLARVVQSFSRHIFRIDVVVRPYDTSKGAGVGVGAPQAVIVAPDVPPAQSSHDDSLRGRHWSLQEHPDTDPQDLTESPNLRHPVNNDGPRTPQVRDENEVQHRKREPARLERIASLRRKAMRDATTMTCQCSRVCKCKNLRPSQDSIVASERSDTMPSLISSERTDSGSTNDSTISRQSASTTLRQVGSRFNSANILGGPRGAWRGFRSTRLRSVVTIIDAGGSSTSHRPSGEQHDSHSVIPNIPEPGSEQPRVPRREQTPDTTSLSPMRLSDAGLTAEPESISDAMMRQPQLRLSIEASTFANGTINGREATDDVADSLHEQTNAGMDGNATPTQARVDASARHISMEDLEHSMEGTQSDG